MKFKIFFTLLLLVHVFKVNGQKLAIGLEGGISGNTIFGNPIAKNYSEVKPLYGYNAGIQTRIALYKALAIKTGLYYERKGVVYNTPNVYSTINGYEGTYISENQFDYLTLPVLLSLNVKFSKKIGTNISSGLYTSYLTNARIVNPNHEDFGSDVDSYPAKSNYNKTDWGGVADLQFYAQLYPQFNITLSSKYFYGFSNVSNTPIVNNGSIHHKSLLLCIGINYVWY